LTKLRTVKRWELF